MLRMAITSYAKAPDLIQNVPIITSVVAVKQDTFSLWPMSSWKWQQQYMQWVPGPTENCSQLLSCFCRHWLFSSVYLWRTFRGPLSHTHTGTLWYPSLMKNGFLLARIWQKVTGFLFAPSSKSLWVLLGCILFLRAVCLCCPNILECRR